MLFSNCLLDLSRPMEFVKRLCETGHAFYRAALSPQLLKDPE